MAGCVRSEHGRPRRASTRPSLDARRRRAPGDVETEILAPRRAPRARTSSAGSWRPPTRTPTTATPRRCACSDRCATRSPTRRACGSSPGSRSTASATTGRAAKELEAFVELTDSVEQHPVLMDCCARAEAMAPRRRALGRARRGVARSPSSSPRDGSSSAGSLADRGRLDEAIAMLARKADAVKPAAGRPPAPLVRAGRPRGARRQHGACPSAVRPGRASTIPASPTSRRARRASARGSRHTPRVPSAIVPVTPVPRLGLPGRASPAPTPRRRRAHRRERTMPATRSTGPSPTTSRPSTSSSCAASHRHRPRPGACRRDGASRPSRCASRARAQAATSVPVAVLGPAGLAVRGRRRRPARRRRAAAAALLPDRRARPRRASRSSPALVGRGRDRRRLAAAERQAERRARRASS